MTPGPWDLKTRDGSLCAASVQRKGVYVRGTLCCVVQPECDADIWELERHGHGPRPCKISGPAEKAERGIFIPAQLPLAHPHPNKMHTFY